ncbi:hypothetical protein KY342_05685 [Candidatus Woesearchaeota archaeon]|nr:hypothetical protein [Candidatus Woesearchaeota archaeon]
MRKEILILLLILCIVLTSCKPVEEVVEEKTIEKTGPTEVKEESKEVRKIVRPQPILSKELTDLIDKTNAVDSLQYFYHSGNDYMNVYVNKEGKMKQVFALRSGIYEPGTRYDTVYLDLNKKTAIAYCENPDDCDEEEQEKEMDVDYDDFITETPFDVLESIESGEIGQEIRIDGKDVVVVETKTNEGYDKKIFLWTYKGIPLKYEIWDGDEKIKRVDYEKLIANAVSYSDLVH